MNTKKIVGFFKKETVLCIALLLAFLSLFLVFPDKEYGNYIDFRTLSLLFCLMSVMAGAQKLGVFEKIAGALLKRVKSVRIVIMILVFLCFGFSMLITNDVALITFVPFTFIVMKLLGEERRNRLLVPVVVMQTVAANLGSMLTPVGNPQNLYLYSKSGVSLFTFMGWLLPYTVVSFVLLLCWCLLQGDRSKEELSITLKKEISLKGKEKQLAAYVVLFVLSLLTVAKVIPFVVTLVITVFLILLVDREVLKRVDYSLLLTFVGFFIFIGNMGRIPAFAGMLQNLVTGNEVYVAVVASQVISNVPAALLLSGFTDRIRDLVIGVDLGGLGTLIASMASLISYKYVVREMPEKKGRYFGFFTIVNVFFLAALICLHMILSR